MKSPPPIVKLVKVYNFCFCLKISFSLFSVIHLAVIPTYCMHTMLFSSCYPLYVSKCLFLVWSEKLYKVQTWSSGRNLALQLVYSHSRHTQPSLWLTQQHYAALTKESISSLHSMTWSSADRPRLQLFAGLLCPDNDTTFVHKSYTISLLVMLDKKEWFECAPGTAEFLRKFKV